MPTVDVAVWLEASATLAAAIVAVRALKLGAIGQVRPSLGDAAWAATLGAAWAAAATLGGAAAFVVALVIVALVLALCLDALMWRVFTVELGPRGVGDIVLSILARELGELGWARRFVRAHLAVFALPVAVAAALARGALAAGAARAGVAAAVSVALAAAVAGTPARRRAWAWLIVAGAAAAIFWRERGATHAVAMAWLGVPVVVLAVTRPLRAWLGPSLAGDFLATRPWPARRAFSPRAEDAALLALARRPVEPSPRRGALAGADVVLVTVESLGQAATREARLPFLEALGARGVTSARHVSPSPTTNNAHVALAFAGYRDDDGATAAVRALAGAGWQTAYLTTARTSYYGLAALLAKAGYGEVIDRDAYGGAVTDHDLYRRGAALAGERLGARRGPRFLHVHTNDTHVPYAVTDPSFRRRGAGADAEPDDRGRWLDSLEEADAIVARLIDELSARGVVRDPLVIVTGDHGQAFGGLGYLTHGSAITAEETLVPFALAHPALPAVAAPVAWSSHFDVLPTVLDLVGVDAPPAFGASIFQPAARDATLVLWAGHPSRATTSNYGVARGDLKYMIDLVTRQVHAMDWLDGGARALAGDEARYAAALCTAAFFRLGLR